MLHRLEQDPIATSGIHARIARSIRHLAENYEAQPSLEEAARAAGLSPHHFQREFSRLAGVSPKSFIAHLTPSGIWDIDGAMHWALPSAE